MRYFVVAAQEENFRCAAERLHIAQPALSRQIADLEGQLGCTLFIRSSRRVHLSPVGKMFLDDALRILRDVDLATTRARQAAIGQIGTLRLGFNETVARSRTVFQSFRLFRAAHPEVELRLAQLTSPAQCEALRAGELDAGFVHLSSDYDEDLRTLNIAVDRFYLAVSQEHPLASRRRILLRDLSDEPFVWITRSKNIHYADLLMRCCLAGGLSPRVVQEAESESMIMNLVSTGLAISLVITTTSESWLPGVVLRPVADLPQTMTLALAWSAKFPAPLTEGFVGTVKEAMANASERKRR